MHALKKVSGLLAAIGAIASMALVLPAQASAATVSIKGHTLMYRADPGETNRFDAFLNGADYRIQEDAGTGTTLKAGPGCSDNPFPGRVVVCPPDSFTHIYVRVLDGSDRVHVDATVAKKPARINGGSGDDVLGAGGGIDRISGGTGDDTLSGGGGVGDRLVAGTGDDIVLALDGDIDRISCGGGLDHASIDTGLPLSHGVRDRATSCELPQSDLDAAPKRGAVLATEALQTCRTDNVPANYENCWLDRLIEIEPTLDSYRSYLSVSGTATGYTVWAFSSLTGNQFKIERLALDGPNIFTCTEPGRAGCPAVGPWSLPPLG